MTTTSTEDTESAYPAPAASNPTKARLRARALDRAVFRQPTTRNQVLGLTSQYRLL